MSESIYTFEEDGGAIFVSLKTPCGTKLSDIAIILEPDSLNPILRIRDMHTNEYSAGLGLSGISEILDYVKELNKELN